jgi:hypothetical protein
MGVVRGRIAPDAADERIAVTTSDKVLVLLLRFLGVSALFALGAVFMPLSWMAATHRWLGLGEMPTEPIVDYLARSVSAFYAVSGGSCLVMAADVERYKPLLRYLGIAQLGMGVVILGVDVAAGLPWWWSYSEGPFGMLVGVLLFCLARSTRRDKITPA